VPHVLTTERLALRPPTPADLEPFVRMCADAEVMRYVGLGCPQDRGTAERGFAVVLAHWERRGWGLWSVLDRASGEYHGFVGLAPVPSRALVAGHTEIGWRLLRAAWGRGLATEAALAVRDHAFGPLGFDELISYCQPDNVASARVMVKLGMTRAGRGRDARGTEVAVYRLRAPAAQALPEPGSSIRSAIDSTIRDGR